MKNKRNQTSDSPSKRCRIISDDSPKKLSFERIKLITNDFSEELGRGAFEQVFKGVLEDGEEVAVKMLRFIPNISDQQFENEFKILKRLEHPNIVRLVGFCDEAQEELVEYKGKLTVCQRIHRALCLEYMPNGSLGKLLSGEILGNNCPIRYKIIKGICKGLDYLREGLEFPIFHFDLKPDNILLNQGMIPKISDFGLSRLIGEENTKKTLTPLGTIGYLPPEFINYQAISKEYDIYSLGVIITKIITGTTGYSDVADMGAQEFVEHVHEKWKECLQEIPKYASLEVDCNQVKRCIAIARRCMENDRHRRPKMKDIVSQLDEMENVRLESQQPIEKWKPDYSPWISDSLPESGGCYMDSDSLCSAHDYSRCYDYDDDSACYDDDSAWTWISSWLPEDCNTSITDTSSLGSPDFRKPYCQDAAAYHGLEGQSGSKKQKKCGNVYDDPPSETSHPTHQEHKLKLVTAGAPFVCDGRKEPGYGTRYARDFGGHSVDLHSRCAALAGDPLSGLHTLVHPLFCYGKQFELHFLHDREAASSAEEATRVCDACGEPTRGFVYHCAEQDVHLHPCCASLPDRFLYDGRAFDLHRRASRPCALCSEDEGQRRWFWAHRCCNMDGDGEAASVDLHVACLKETARRSWEGDDGSLNVESVLEKLAFDKFGEIAGTVASFVMALVFGDLMLKM